MQQAPFDERFNGLDIYIQELEIESGFDIVIPETGSEGTMKSIIMPKMPRITDVDTSKRIITEMILLLRNQGNGTTGIRVYASFVAESDESKSCPDFLAELTDYMFELVSRYVKENNLKDKNGSDFIMPGFGYSRESFKDWRC